jgi:hypothetical protein
MGTKTVNIPEDSKSSSSCGLSRAVEFIVVLGALGKIGVALAQSGAYAWLGLGRYADILFQRTVVLNEKGISQN